MDATTVDRPHLQATIPQPPPAEVPRRLAAYDQDGIMSVLTSALGAVGLVWVVNGRLLPLSGPVAYLLCTFLVFLCIYGGVTALSQPRTVLVDRLSGALIWAGALVVGAALVSVVVYTYYRGWHALPHKSFYLHDMAGVGPQDKLDRGGVLHAIVGTLIELGIAVIAALPLGIGAAVYMTEVGGRLATIVRTVVEAMTALPDLLAGLFVYTTLIVRLGVQRSGLAAGISLTIMMLPIVARSAEVALRVVPGGLREAGIALGATRWRTVTRVVLPTAAPGLATALILALARGVGETAPVLITSGASTYFNANPVSNPMNSLPLFVYTAVRSGEPTYITRGFGAASVLLGVVLVLFAVIRLLARTRATGR